MDDVVLGKLSDELAVDAAAEQAARIGRSCLAGPHYPGPTVFLQCGKGGGFYPLNPDLSPLQT